MADSIAVLLLTLLAVIGGFAIWAGIIAMLRRRLSRELHAYEVEVVTNAVFEIESQAALLYISIIDVCRSSDPPGGGAPQQWREAFSSFASHVTSYLNRIDANDHPEAMLAADDCYFALARTCDFYHDQLGVDGSFFRVERGLLGSRTSFILSAWRSIMRTVCCRVRYGFDFLEEKEMMRESTIELPDIAEELGADIDQPDSELIELAPRSLGWHRSAQFRSGTSERVDSA